MTHEEVIARIKSGRFANEYGFDLQILVNAVGALGEMLRNGYTIALPPRLMTLEEVKASKGADMYLEISTRTDEIPYITAATLDGVGTKGVVFYCSHFDFVAYGRRLYGWRCWTAKPDEKVRAETPWQSQ